MKVDPVLPVKSSAPSTHPWRTPWLTDAEQEQSRSDKCDFSLKPFCFRRVEQRFRGRGDGADAQTPSGDQNGPNPAEEVRRWRVSGGSEEVQTRYRFYFTSCWCWGAKSKTAPPCSSQLEGKQLKWTGRDLQTKNRSWKLQFVLVFYNQCFNPHVSSFVLFYFTSCAVCFIDWFYIKQRSFKPVLSAWILHICSSCWFPLQSVNK